MSDEHASQLFAEFRALGAELGDVLVPPGRTRAMGVAAAMFGAACPEFAFECHLEQPEPRVDLTVRVKRRQRDLLVHADLPPEVRRFLRHWGARSSPIEAVPFVEFEFDLPDCAATPWIGPAVEPLLRSGPRAVQRQRDLREQRSEAAPALPLEVLDLLGDAPLDPPTRRRVVQALTELPRWGLIGQLARLDGRPSGPREGVRMFLSIPRAECQRYLDRLEWPGSWSALDRRISDISPRATWLDLDFGIHRGQLELRLGYYVEFRGPRAQDSQLRAMLDLIRAGLPRSEDAVRAIGAWAASTDGRQDRVLTFKFSLHPELETRMKVYFSRLRRSAPRFHGRSRAHA
jgi:hypothetical protein